VAARVLRRVRQAPPAHVHRRGHHRRQPDHGGHGVHHQAPGQRTLRPAGGQRAERNASGTLRSHPAAVTTAGTPVTGPATGASGAARDHGSPDPGSGTPAPAGSGPYASSTTAKAPGLAPSWPAPSWPERSWPPAAPPHRALRSRNQRELLAALTGQAGGDRASARVSSSRPPGVLVRTARGIALSRLVPEHPPGCQRDDHGPDGRRAAGTAGVAGGVAPGSGRAGTRLGVGPGARGGSLDPHAAAAAGLSPGPGAPDHGRRGTWTSWMPRLAGCGPRAGPPRKTPAGMTTPSWTGAT